MVAPPHRRRVRSCLCIDSGSSGYETWHENRANHVEIPTRWIARPRPRLVRMTFPSRIARYLFVVLARTIRRGGAGGGATNVSPKTPHQSELAFIEGNCRNRCNCCLQPRCCRCRECSTQRVRNGALSYQLQNPESNYPIFAGLELRQRAETAPDENHGQYLSAWHIFRADICRPVHVFRQFVIWAAR